MLYISDIHDKRIQMFAHMTETQLRHGQSGDGNGLFIVESPKVIAVALAHGYRPEALLCEQRHIHGDAAEIIAALPQDTPVYTGDRNTLAALTGYTLTRGVLCAMRRPAPRSDVEVCRDARRVAVIDGVCDTTNTGAIFRSAAALGMDAVLLTPGSCDPFNRRCVRVSMGGVFLVPWAYIQGNDTIARLHQLGLDTAALALRGNDTALDDPRLTQRQRLALIVGTEGEGLDPKVINAADFTVRIPMHRDADSLNVAAAAAIAFWQLRNRDIRNGESGPGFYIPDVSAVHDAGNADASPHLTDLYSTNDTYTGK